MKTITRKLILLSVAVIAAAFFATAASAAEPMETNGTLVTLDSPRNMVTVSTEILGLSGLEKKDVNFSVRDDVSWTICLNGQCAEASGAEGYRMVNDYETFKPYGIMTLGCGTTLFHTSDVVTGIRVNIC